MDVANPTHRFAKAETRIRFGRMAVRSDLFSIGMVIAFLWVLSSGNIHAQETKRFSVAETSSPRDTLRSFIEACNAIKGHINEQGFYDRTRPETERLRSIIIDCIDLSQVPDFAREYRSTEIAVCLKEIVDRIDIPEWESIPDIDAIEAAGGFEKLTTWRIPRSRLTISRIESGPQKHEYLFSAGTAQRAISYYRQIEDDPYRTSGPPISEGLCQWYFNAPSNAWVGSLVKQLPDSMQNGRSYGMANWKWPGVLIAIVVACSLLISVLKMQWALSDLARAKGTGLFVATLVFPVAAIMIPLIFQSVLETQLTVRGMPLYVMGFCANLTVILLGMLLVFSVANRVAEYIIASPRIDPKGLNAQQIRIAAKIVSVIGVLLLFISGGQYLGIAIGTLMASAGIFGAAIALAAQDVIKGVFGTLTLLSDKPFRAGDRIMFEKYDGVIEDIGLRSTRLRLLTGSLVTIPNDRLAGNHVENVTNRKSLRRQTLIRLPLDTPLAKVEEAVAIIRKELIDHQGMLPEFPPRVFFDDIGSDAFTVRIFYWFSPPEYWAYKEFGESFNFSIFRQFEELGIQFSMPLRHSFWKTDSDQGPMEIQLIDPPDDK